MAKNVGIDRCLPTAAHPPTADIGEAASAFLAARSAMPLTAGLQRTCRESSRLTRLGPSRSASQIEVTISLGKADHVSGHDGGETALHRNPPSR